MNDLHTAGSLENCDEVQAAFADLRQQIREALTLVRNQKRQSQCRNTQHEASLPPPKEPALNPITTLDDTTYKQSQAPSKARRQGEAALAAIKLETWGQGFICRVWLGLGQQSWKRQ